MHFDDEKCHQLIDSFKVPDLDNMSDDKKLNPQEIKAELDWISSSNYESFEKKNPKSRFSEKLADNPLVPIGK